MLRPAKLAGVGGSRASQVCCPSHVSRVAAICFPSKCTVTSAAAGANPQTTELSGADWSTIPSPRIEEKRKLGLPASSLLNLFTRDRASTDSISRSRPLGARPPTLGGGGGGGSGFAGGQWLCGHRSSKAESGGSPARKSLKEISHRSQPGWVSKSLAVRSGAAAVPQKPYLAPPDHHSQREQGTPSSVSSVGPLALAWMPQKGVHWQSAGAGLMELFVHCSWVRAGPPTLAYHASPSGRSQRLICWR